MTVAQPIDGMEPLTKSRRLLEINEFRARDAEARLRFIVAELQIRELSEKLANARRVRTKQEPEDHSVGPEVRPATTEAALETVPVSTGPEPAKDEKVRDHEKRPRLWRWGRAARKK